MRWTVMSIVVAVVLLVLGFYVPGSDATNIVAKVAYWLCVAAFSMAQGIHFLVWVRKHDL